MALSFFGKGIGALGWAVMSDTAPKEITGLTGGVFNMCGNLSSISTPIIIGIIIQRTGSFNGALVFVAANAALAIVSYVFVVGEIKRMVLKDKLGQTVRLEFSNSERNVPVADSEVKFTPPPGIAIKADKPTQLTITGFDRQQVGQVAAEIRGMKKPEPYKGKGIKYQGERIRRKEGKKK